MYKKIIFCISIVALMGLAACQSYWTEKSCKTYIEAIDPAPDTTANWADVKPGLQASVGSIDNHYYKSSVPQISQLNGWHGTAWRGEKVSAQLVLWSKDPIRNVACEFSEFVAGDGQIIPATIAKARFVRYVITDEFADGCGTRKPEDYAASLAPDALDNVKCYNMEGNTTRPAWVTIHVPADAEPGVYKSTLKVFAGGQETHSFDFELEVLPRLLPPGTQWEFHLDLWQNPFSVARVHDVKLWSKTHWNKLKPLMKMLADAGQKVITVSLNKRPWGGQTEDQFESMIQWKKKSDGDWEYDYTIFDNWIQFMMDLGIKKQISCYSMVPWGNELYYFDEKTGEEVKVKADPGSKEYIELWTPFLEDFRAHLEQKGWNKITRIAMDERAPKEMKAMLKLLNDVAPEFGVALADNHKSYKLYPDQLKDLCVSHGATIEDRDLEYRKSKGYVSTYYVCCGHRFPNTFTFSPPADAVFIGWYAMAAGLDGFLRWSYCSWVKDPLQDSRFRTWPAGDTYIVYPDARSSIRFERLVEGIQDAEKIRILKKELEGTGTSEAQQKLELLNKIVTQFNIISKPEDSEGLLNHGKKILEELSR